MDFHPKAHVECTDGRIGRLEDIIINPKVERITHLVVRENDLGNSQRLVPEKYVKDADHKTVQLSIDKKEFEKMKSFIQEEYIPSNILLYMADQEGWYAGTPAAVFVEHEAIPEGRVAVQKGAKVYATDGHVGRVDEFLVQGKSGLITHLVMVEGHLWGKKDIAIPVTEIDHYEEDGDIRLKITKDQVEGLPVFDEKRE
ncbi:conserved hypothetical protein [delta proteobacterium NaphS2]|nr:conserved hypothetical protein [delta proteobacterium NaphS2]